MTWYLSDGKSIWASSEDATEVTIYRANGEVMQRLQMPRCTARGYVDSYCRLNNVRVVETERD
jgi:hypothetical protein